MTRPKGGDRRLHIITGSRNPRPVLWAALRTNQCRSARRSCRTRQPARWQTRQVATSQPPTPYRTVTPRIFVDDPETAVTFLHDVFDATAEIEPGRPTRVHIGDCVVLVGSTTERGWFPAFLHVYVDDADAAYQRAIQAGATSIEKPLDTPYGDRRAMFSDTFGNIYQVAHRRDAGV